MKMDQIQNTDKTLIILQPYQIKEAKVILILKFCNICNSIEFRSLYQFQMIVSADGIIQSFEANNLFEDCNMLNQPLCRILPELPIQRRFNVNLYPRYFTIASFSGIFFYFVGFAGLQYSGQKCLRGRISTRRHI